jgi:Alanyl-tRNA synthetase
MEAFSTNQLRKMWLDFFVSKDHQIIEPASLIPFADDTLLWINSGVAALKEYFDGRKKPTNPRLTNSQKSIRTNDIENVGFTARHHTLFEMLGSFSIGQYFKKEAIVWAWEFLTSPAWLNLDQNQFYITIYQEDKVAFQIWTEVVGLDPQRIIQGDKKTNFWEIGPGPCGPNTEIFWDRGEKYDPEKKGLKLLKEDLENDRYLEIWNIVFSQYNNDGQGNYQELPQKNIDTGMGLERIASVMQDVPTSYDTDQFQIIIKAVEKFTNITYQPNNFFIKDLVIF